MWPTTLEQPHFVSCAAATDGAVEYDPLPERISEVRHGALQKKEVKASFSLAVRCCVCEMPKQWKITKFIGLIGT